MIDNDENGTDVNNTELLKYGALFYQALKFPWFKDMFTSRFDVQNVIDDESRTVTLTLVEVPPQEAMKRLQKQAKEDEASKPKIFIPE